MADSSTVDAAKQKRDAIQAELIVKQQALAAAKKDPTRGLEVDSLTQEVRNLTTVYNQADKDFVREKAAFDKANPPPKQPTPRTEAGQSADALAKENQRQREVNYARHGRYVTDEVLIKEGVAQAPKPARTDSPAQIAAVNNSAQSNANTAVHNQNTDTNAAVDSQIRALTAAGVFANTARSTISSEANNRTQTSMAGIKQVQDAAKDRLTYLNNQREQNVSLARTRADNARAMLLDIQQNAAKIAMMSKKGSGIAKQWAKGALASYQQAMKELNATGEVAEIDPNDPALATLKFIAGYKLPDKLPEMPSPEEMDKNTMIFMAVAGMPVPGWNGPIGAEAIKLYDAWKKDPTTPLPIATQKPAEDAVRAYANTPEGQQIAQAGLAPVKALLDKQASGGTLTPDEIATLEGARRSVLGQLQSKAPKTTGSTAVPETLEGKINQVLDSGTPEQQNKLMMLAASGYSKQSVGETLSPEEDAVMKGLSLDRSKKAHDLVTAADFNAVLKKQLSGQTLTPEEDAFLNAGRNDFKMAKPEMPAPLTPEEKPTMEFTKPQDSFQANALSMKPEEDPNLPRPLDATFQNQGEPFSTDARPSFEVPTTSNPLMSPYNFTFQNQGDPLPNDERPSYEVPITSNPLAPKPPVNTYDGFPITLPPLTREEEELKRRGLFTGSQWFR